MKSTKVDERLHKAVGRYCAYPVDETRDEFVEAVKNASDEDVLMFAEWFAQLASTMYAIAMKRGAIDKSGLIIVGPTEGTEGH